MKKFLTVLLAGLLSLAVLSGCDRTPSKPKPVDPDDITVNLDPNMEATIEIMVPGGNVNERTMIQCLIDDFADLFPNVSIEMSYVSVDNYVSAVGQQQLCRFSAMPAACRSHSCSKMYLCSQDIGAAHFRLSFLFSHLWIL